MNNNSQTSNKKSHTDRKGLFVPIDGPVRSVAITFPIEEVMQAPKDSHGSQTILWSDKYGYKLLIFYDCDCPVKNNRASAIAMMEVRGNCVFTDDAKSLTPEHLDDLLEKAKTIDPVVARAEYAATVAKIQAEINKQFAGSGYIPVLMP